VAVRSYREIDAYGRAYQDPYMINLQPERLRDAARMLPENGVVGYLSDLSLADPPGQAAYFGVANALAPRLVVRDPDSPQWVLGNFSRPQDFAAMGGAHRLDLVRDLGNGVVIFRRRAQ
jgi:hypothetical protein